MSSAALSSSKPINYFTNPNSKSHYFPSRIHQVKINKREFHLPEATAAVSSAFPFPQQPINVDYLEKEFSNHGVTFTELGESCVVRMEVENGSVATLLLPSGLITSYKPKLWHGGKQEVLHTCVFEGENGVPVIQGGVSLALSVSDHVDEEGEDGFSWCANSWSVNDVRGDSSDSIQVEIVSREPQGMAEVKYTITLNESTLISEITASNYKSTRLQLTALVLSHLVVSTPDATYAIGLEGSYFSDRPPLLSEYSIIPPNQKQSKSQYGISTRRSPLQNIFRAARGTDSLARDGNNSGITAADESNDSEEMLQGEEDDNYKRLTDKLCRIYTNSSRRVTLIDRGKRNSLTVGRNGFQELYIFSPGSSHEWYGKYAYVSVGLTALLKPIVLGPQEVWKGEQHLHNPNL